MRGRNQLLHEELTYKVRGILYKTQNELGNYRNEKQYADKIELELKKAGMKYEREKVLTESFDFSLSCRLSPFLIYDKIKTKGFNLWEKKYYQI